MELTFRLYTHLVMARDTCCSFQQIFHALHEKRQIYHFSNFYFSRYDFQIWAFHKETWIYFDSLRIQKLDGLLLFAIILNFFAHFCNQGHGNTSGWKESLNFVGLFLEHQVLLEYSHWYVLLSCSEYLNSYEAPSIAVLFCHVLHYHVLLTQDTESIYKLVVFLLDSEFDFSGPTTHREGILQHLLDYELNHNVLYKQVLLLCNYVKGEGGRRHFELSAFLYCCCCLQQANNYGQSFKILTKLSWAFFI